jgi:hypothetical protein
MLNLPTGMHITQIAEHDVVKHKLLYMIEDIIEDEPKRSLNPAGYHYDYNFTEEDSNYHPAYKSLLFNTISPYLEKYAQSLGMRIRKFSKPWFQQYTTGTGFGWHQHGLHFAVVYYLELPDPNEATEFLQYGKMNVKEGDIIVFPTWMVHRSANIKSDKRKTIFACNVDFEVDREYIKEHYEDR